MRRALSCTASITVSPFEKKQRYFRYDFETSHFQHSSIVVHCLLVHMYSDIAKTSFLRDFDTFRIQTCFMAHWHAGVNSVCDVACHFRKVIFKLCRPY